MSNKILTRTLLVLALVSSLMFSGCNKDGIQAEKSLKGEWNVVSISSYYGEYRENGVSPTETIDEAGQLGTFHFTTDLVEYNFMRNDTLYTEKASWGLDLAKVRSGFSRVNEFTLTIEDHFLFDVKFDDGTRNSEKNANRVTFIETPGPGFGVAIKMLLEKK